MLGSSRRHLYQQMPDLCEYHIWCYPAYTRVNYHGYGKPLDFHSSVAS